MKSIRDVDLTNKRVIIRCDLNVPIEDGLIKDNTRITKSLDTINYVIERASKVIILSHLGRIKTEEDIKNNSLKIVCDELSKQLNKEITFLEYDDNINENVNKSNLIMFENTRFFDVDNNKESSEDTNLSKYFASFGDIFINDAFSCSHRECSSLTGISKILPSYNGLLVEEEINNLSKLLNNYENPYTICLGGKKVSDKIGVIDNLINKVDYILISGLMVYTFLKALGYETGTAFVEEDRIDYCKNLLNNYRNKIILIEDLYVKNNNERIHRNLDEININDECLDIGEKTIEVFKEYLLKSKTIFINGPFGLFEDPIYGEGSKKMCEIVSSLDCDIYAGGGETNYMLNKFGVKNAFMSTGGGATLTYLSTGKLIGVIE